MTPDFARRVLLVDDDPMIIDGLQLILESNGFACRTATNGFEALKALRLTLPDIIICDLRMPNMSGFELLPILRRRYPGISVIVISSESVESVQAMGLPMDAYFQKGAYAAEQLIARIHAVDLYLHRRHLNGSRSDPSTEEKV
jgi:DNA-binding response OmpR family regulator